MQNSRKILVRDEEDLLERSVKKPKENEIVDANMDDEMKDDGVSIEVVAQSEPRKLEGVTAKRSNKLVTYRDIVLQLNGDGEDSGNEEEDWMAIQKKEEEEADCTDEEGHEVPDDPLCPVYRFSHHQHKEDCKKWKDALIIKLLGKRINNRYLMSRLLKLWELKGRFEIIDLENGYILVNFHENKDYNHVLHEGPWIVVQHYVIVQRWRPMFDPFDEKVKRLAV